MKNKSCLIDFHKALPQNSSISWSTIYAISLMKSQNIAINNTFLSEQMSWTTIKNDKMISGIKYINSLCIQSCILKNVRHLPFSLGHTLSLKGISILWTAIDMKIRSTDVQKTYVTISEGIAHCIDWKMAFVWLLNQHSTPKFPIIAV